MSFYVKRTPEMINASFPSQLVTPDEREILEYGIRSFNHLIPNWGCVMADEFSYLISKHYDNPKADCVVSVLNRIFEKESK